MWKSRPEEFAARFYSSRLSTWLGSGLDVDESQLGLLFESGRFEQELMAGRHRMESLPDRIRRFISGETASAVLIRKGLFSIPVSGAVLTSAGDEVAWECELGIRIADRNVFYVNLMHGRDVIVASDLMRLFGHSVRQAVHAVVASCRSTELLTLHPELQQRLSDMISETVAPVAARNGLAVAFVTPPVFSNQHLGQFLQERSQMQRELRIEKLRDQFQREKNEIEVRRYETGRILSEATFQQQVQEAERTAHYDQVKAEIRHRSTIAGMDLSEKLEQAVDGWVERKEAREQRRTDQRNEQEGKDSLRAHLLAATEIQRQEELLVLRFSVKRRELQQQHELTELERTEKLKAAETELRAQLDQMNATVAGKIDRWRKIRQAQRDDRIAEATANAQAAGITADARRAQLARDANEALRQEAQRHDENIDQEWDRLDLKTEKLKRLSEIQSGHLRRMREVQRYEQETQLIAEREQHQRQEDSQDRTHRRRLEEAQLLKDSPEIVQLLKLGELAATSTALVPAFNESMRLLMSRGMSAEQLEILAAQQSPAVAQFLTERVRAQNESARASERQQMQLQQDSWERVVAEMKASRELSERQVRDFMDRLERVGVHGQDLLRDVGLAAASRPEKVLPTGGLNEQATASLIDRLEMVCQTMKRTTENSEKKDS